MDFDNASTEPRAQAQPGARPGITIPAPAEQVVAHPHGDPEELERKFRLEPLKPSMFLREKATGVVHRYSPEFGERSDLMENYHPTLPELLRFKTSVSDLITWGYTAEQLHDAGVSIQALSDGNVPVATLHKLGASIEWLQAQNHDTAGLEPKVAKPKAAKKPAPKLATPAPVAPPAPDFPTV